MRVLELSLRNFRVFEQVDLELPARVIGIFGENGAGKSTLMEAIAFALYGVDAARTKKQQIRTHGVLVDCEVRVAFEHAGQPYEVRRAIGGRGHAPDARLFGGDLQLAAGTTEVDAEIRRLLHMDLHVFRSSVFAEQKQLDAFSSMRPGERKEMALRLLGIKPVDDARTAARRQARSTKETAQQLEGAVADLAALEAELKDAKGALAEANALAKSAAAELKGAVAAERAASKAFAQADAARERVATLTVRLRAKTEERDGLLEQRDTLVLRIARTAEALQELPAIEEELATLGDVQGRLDLGRQVGERAGELAQVRAELEAVPQVDAASALADLEAAAAELEATRHAAAEAEAERAHRVELVEEAAERVERVSEADPSEPCPTCGRPLGDDFPAFVRHRKAELAEAKRVAADAAKRAKAALAARERATKAHAASAAAGERARDADHRRSALAVRVEELAGLFERLAEPFGGQVPDLEALRAAGDRAAQLGMRVAALGVEREHLANAERDLATVEGKLADAGRALADLTTEAEALSFDEAEHGSLRAELEGARVELEEARAAEREAGDAAKDAEKAVAELAAALAQARETASRVDELRSDARYVERVGMLLDGFRDHLVARVGPELSREAEALFRELTNHEYDDLRVDEETLSIQVADGDEYFPIDRFSGSETDLANLALRIAISTQLSRMSGADVGMLVLDEVLASLDEERKDLMVQTLGRLSARFHQLFVITHAERVKDQFPASILVRKIGRRRSVAELV